MARASEVTGPMVILLYISCLSLDLEFVKTFLLTYQSFATPDKLLRKLIERYNVVRPDDMSLVEFAHMRQTIQARVINALRLWVEYGVDFKGKSLIICELDLIISVGFTINCTTGVKLFNGFYFFPDNSTLQNNILHFISTVLVLDHARLCRPLRTNILSIRVSCRACTVHATTVKPSN